MQRSVQNPVQSEIPSNGELAMLLSAHKLQTAEVVELADTPSANTLSVLQWLIPSDSAFLFHSKALVARV